MHPHKGEAHASSRDKFRAITGHAGGGHAYAGGSHLKKPGAHGELKTWSGHHKTHHDDEHAHGSRARARADRFARGGRAKYDKGGEALSKRKKFPTPTRENPLPSQIAGPEETKGWYQRLSGRGNPEYRSAHMGQELGDLARSKRGGRMKRGGRAEGGREEDEDSTRQLVNPAPTGKYKPKREVPLRGWDEPVWKSQESGEEHPASGRKKYAHGGRTKGKAPHSVTINVIQRPPGGGGAPPRPPILPLAPPAPPPGGGPVQAPPMGGGAPPGGNPLGGSNPLAGLNKGMGGMGFARGGRTKKTTGEHPNPAAGPRGGDARYDLADWRKYAQTEREKRLSGKAGLTQAYTKKIGDDGSLDVQPVKPGRRASGGGIKMRYGAQSGMGRLEKSKYEVGKY